MTPIDEPGAEDGTVPEPADAPGRDVVGEEPASAVILFGERIELARRYVAILASAGVERGLIGPREVPILWSRHVVNSALLAGLLPSAGHVVDVGTGAGLPGLVLAIRRPELRVTLVEPLLRRCTFLTEVVTGLGLTDQVRVVRGRAEERSVRDAVGGADWVVARAVAPLQRLVGWCVPLLRDGGRLLALKGERAAVEVAEAATALARTGGVVRGISELGDEGDRTWVVTVERVPRSTRGSRPRR